MKTKILFTLLAITVFCNLYAQQWQRIGLEKERVNAIAVNPLNNAIIYAGSTSSFSDGIYGKLLRSSDFGNTWDTLMYNISVQKIALHPKKPNIIYVALASTNFTRPGILKSTNAGESWFWADSGITLNFEISVATVVAHPDSFDVVYAGTVGFFGGNMYKSIDGGNYWTKYPDEVMCCQFEDIFFDPVEPSTIYVGSGKLYRTVDDGKNWTAVQDWTAESGGVKLAIDNKNNNTLYAGRPRYRLEKSVDYGENWFFADTGITDYRFQDLDISLIDSKKLFTITADGIVFTADGAVSWYPNNQGFPIDLIKRTLELSPDESFLYCGTDSGLYKLDLVTSLENNSNYQPGKATLLQNYPNPFNSTTTIPFTLDKPDNLEINLYDTSGKRVYQSGNNSYAAGYNEHKINLKNIATGLYFYELQSKRTILRKKLLLIK